jgi:hypothetical protein
VDLILTKYDGALKSWICSIVAKNFFLIFDHVLWLSFPHPLRGHTCFPHEHALIVGDSLKTRVPRERQGHRMEAAI